MFQIKAIEFTNLESAEKFVNDFCKNNNVIYVDIKPVKLNVKINYVVVIQYQI